MNRRTLLPLTLAVLLAGCASGPRCISDEDYRDAATLPAPPAETVGNLKLPESASALRIPPPPANPSKTAPGLDCLDSPPRLAEDSEAPVTGEQPKP